MTLLDIFLTIQQDAAGTPGQPQGSGISMIIMLVLMFAVFYLFMIRPQQKKQKELNKFRESLKPGSKVMTVGGIHGTIVSVLDTTFIVAIAQDVNISVEKSCIIADSSDLAPENAAK
ncbi:MAG: preprotein translocase subunit YajC [Bacteroidales bacterium]|nr:preprotein translocase subunit YajC [Bacteroidales bacterium]